MAIKINNTTIIDDSRNIVNAGVVTATGFVGNVTGTATGLSGSPNVNVGVITATSYRGDGSQLTGVGVGATSNVNTTGIGTFGTVVATNDLDIPNGTTAQRPAVPLTGSFRYNSSVGFLEFYDGTNWRSILLDGTLVSNPSDTGIFGGGIVASGVAVRNIDYITISTTGNATNFGSLTAARYFPAACSSSTRGVFGGGTTPTNTNIIDYVNIATTSNATYFGDLTQTRGRFAACSSSTRGVFGGGYTPVPVDTRFNIIDYVTIATTGNAIDFGDLTVTRDRLASCSSSTRGIFGGGTDPAAETNTIDYITIATTGNATDFGDLTLIRKQLAACSSSTRGVFGGGISPISPSATNTIDYITIATTGNATDFGDLTVARRELSACSSSTRGVFGGGYSPSSQNVIDYITIASTGNATDFGDLTVARSGGAACSSGHGGLS